MKKQFHEWKPRTGAWAAGVVLAAGLGLGVAAAQAPPVPQPRILELYNTANPQQDSVFALDSYITLVVKGLEPYMQQEEATLLARQVPAERAHKLARQLVLYINDAPLIGMTPVSMHSLPAVVAGQLPDTSQAAQANARTKVIFHLARNQNTYTYWNVVYRSPWEFEHPGRIGLGYDDRVITNIYPQTADSVRLKLVRPVALGVAIVVVLLLAGAIVQLARKSWLLRDSVPNWTAPAGKQPTFSLAKSQLAWWTFLVLGSYLLIFCVTGEMTTISTTTLELLGISAGTAGLGTLLGTPSRAPTAAVPASQSWWHDVLSDENGVSIHRLQQVAFTLLLGYLFVRTVYKTVALPEWNDNEIALLGISSATYLGLKAQENNAAKDKLKDLETFDSKQTSGAKVAADAPADGTDLADPAASLVTVNVDSAAPAADLVSPLAAAPLAGAGTQSVANPVTGAVLYRVEDDMGPDAPATGPEVDERAENPNQIPG